jgi:hypothetical protein
MRGFQQFAEKLARLAARDHQRLPTEWGRLVKAPD